MKNGAIVLKENGLRFKKYPMDTKLWGKDKTRENRDTSY